MSKLEQMEVAMTQRQKEVCIVMIVSLIQFSVFSLSSGGDDGCNGEGEKVCT